VDSWNGPHVDFDVKNASRYVFWHPQPWNGLTLDLLFREEPTSDPMARNNLSLYHSRRDFAKTAEPSGKTHVKSAEHLRFVIQKHAASHLHYDLRLELNGVFKSWAVTKGPSVDPRDRRLAVEVEDHPLDYGDFEGTIPQGEYGGGTVMVWDRGLWAPEDGGDPERALRKGELKFILAGEKLKGSWVLVLMRRNRERNNRKNWLLIKHRDAESVRTPLLSRSRTNQSHRGGAWRRLLRAKAAPLKRSCWPGKVRLPIRFGIPTEIELPK
jgi:DNA ligase D-like protein (predicted 3'-phosphoesterase)